MAFPAATDEAFLLDGVTVWQPQALVYTGGEVFDLGGYTAQEGTYEDEEAA